MYYEIINIVVLLLTVFASIWSNTDKEIKKIFQEEAIARNRTVYIANLIHYHTFGILIIILFVFFLISAGSFFESVMNTGRAAMFFGNWLGLIIIMMFNDPSLQNDMVKQTTITDFDTG